MSPDCGKELKFASYVKLHMDMMHRGIQTNVRDQCDYQSKTKPATCRISASGNAMIMFL